MQKRVDLNQSLIVQALRQAGATVQHLHTIGRGCPDLLVGIHGVNLLVEVKSHDGAKLTPDESRWHSQWRGQVAVATSVEAALDLLKIGT